MTKYKKTCIAYGVTKQKVKQLEREIRTLTAERDLYREAYLKTKGAE